MKNHRDVCLAKDAGYIEFDELPGSIRTGCIQTPAFKSRFCKHHKSLCCKLQPDSQMLQNPQEESGEPVIEMVVGKRTTRNETHYQVCIKSLDTDVMSVEM